MRIGCLQLEVVPANQSDKNETIHSAARNRNPRKPTYPLDGDDGEYAAAT
jgi:hypothetical protein